MDPYKKALQTAASQKLCELYKFCLDVLDEIIEDNHSKLEVFKKSIEKFDDSEVILPFVDFLEINEQQKKQIRKRILDRGNDLIREMEL